MEIKPQIATGEYRIQQREPGEGGLIRRDGTAGEGGGIAEQSDAADIQSVPAKDTSPAPALQAPGESRLLMGLASSSAILNAAASAMSSPSLSMPLEEALKKLSAKNVEFFRTRGFFIPVIMKKTVMIYPAEMAKIMTQGSEKARAGLSAVVDGETTVKPFTETDARELLAFKKLDTTSCTPNPDLASLLQKAAKEGITIEGEGDVKGAFGAYRHLVSQSSDGPVRLSRKGAELAVVTKAELSDIPALEAKLNKMDSLLSSLKGSLDLFNLAASPVDGTTLEERAQAMQKMLSHSRSDKYDDSVASVQKDWQVLREKSRDGRELISLARLYTDMLDANNRSYWQSSYREGLELILSRFKDHPEEAAAFNDLLKRDIGISTAAKIFNTLPQPVKPGDFENVAALFHNDSSTYFYWSPEKVELVMAPQGDSSLADRIDITMRLHRHCKDSDSTEKGWKNVKSEIENLAALSKDSNFTKTGKLYADMLDANNKSNLQSSYREGLELIVSRFRDNPDEMAAFNDLLRRGIDIPTAAKIFNTLPQPVKPGDFGKAAALFHNNSSTYFYWSPEKVELVMTPQGDSSLADRIDITMRLHRHCKDSDSTEKGWKNVKSEIENLAALSKDSNFTKTGKLYADMLDANNKSNLQSSYREGLGLILSRFRDHPEEAAAFNDMLKRGIDILTAAKIFITLPQPVKQGDFEKTAALFHNDTNIYFYWSPEKVELAAAPARGTTLKDRIEMIHSLARMDKSSESSEESWKNIRDDFVALKAAAGDGFPHYADLYMKALTMASRTYRDKSHEIALGLITGDLAKDAEHWKIYQELLEQSKYLLYANDAYLSVLAPVQGEPLPVRKEAVKKLMGPDFSAFYKMACRNIPAGETVLDSASILGSFEKIRGEHSVKECEALFKKIVQAKGSFTGSSVADLVRYVDFNHPEMLTGLIEDLNSLKASESFEGRRDVFVSFFRKHFDENTRNLDEARKEFSSIHRSLGETDSIAEAAGRFDTLHEHVKSCDEARKENPLALTADCMDFIESNLKSGNFGECTRDELYADFESILLLSKKVDDAKFQLLHRHQPSPDSTIEHSDDAVIIGGVKLDVKKTWKNP
ncbi:MAG: hypothetical protein AB2L14_18010 [Candidatus Xenobiia bacterium LiM19]